MLTVIVLDRSASAYKRRATTLARRLLSHLKLARTDLEIYLVGDAFMNKNVLSFPADAAFPRPDLKGQRALGEVYLNPTYIKRHDENTDYLLIHGILHLLGYDHVRERDRITMERLEQKLLRKITNS